ncbi:MAG TPA: hypothetical protein DIT58_12880, partial [Porticoccaceae bacterium]|nr:hypothetical protein [Porticoccaceae bacterium]
MAKHTMKPLAAAVGAAFMASAITAPVAVAAENPFQLNQLSGGYNLASKAEGEGKCGEGKCGEGKCGGDKAKTKTKAEGKCGEGKCGEGKCGGAKT